MTIVQVIEAATAMASPVSRNARGKDVPVTACGIRSAAALLQSYADQMRTLHFGSLVSDLERSLVFYAAATT